MGGWVGHLEGDAVILDENQNRHRYCRFSYQGEGDRHEGRVHGKHIVKEKNIHASRRMKTECIFETRRKGKQNEKGKY